MTEYLLTGTLSITPPPPKKKKKKRKENRKCKIRPNEPVHEISNNVICATSKASDQPAHTPSLIRAFARRLNIL